MSNQENKKIISFEVSAELYEKIKAAAHKDDRSISSYIRKVINLAATSDLTNNSF